MRYIICEDDTSGFYFWTFISKYILTKDYTMITASEINETLGLKSSVQDKNTLGIFKVKDFLEKITSKDYKGKFDDNNTYIICIDNVPDNTVVNNSVGQIHNIVGKRKNFHAVDYICFEQLLISSKNDLQFFPKLNSLPEYNILKQHANTYGLGHSRELQLLLKKNNIRYGTTERIYAKLMENAVVRSKNKIGKREYIIAFHHYILKGKWSVCWTTDCTPNCPNDKCWEATGDNNLMCDKCSSTFKNKSQSCVLINNTYKRKYAEEQGCSRTLPNELRERFKMLFDIKEIKQIDNLQ